MEVLRSGWQVIAYCWMPLSWLWKIGSLAPKPFCKKKIVLLAKPTGRRESLSKRHSGFTPELIISQVANQFDVSPDAYVGFRCRSEGREIAALLCRELTNASLAELSTAFGLAHPDSSANLAKKAKQLLGDSKKYKNNYHRIKETLLKTENQV